MKRKLTPEILADKHALNEVLRGRKGGKHTQKSKDDKAELAAVKQYKFLKRQLSLEDDEVA